ncbi:hypothetical protein VD0002_g3628 [Verticillium dahliae]|nr:hypothetical protein VD0004_g5858 [Verticillium dahliae]PNH65345.1 hypothetical protein VD0002_g3628 [Verticillium dahliae]PNH71409.1 hypothetical protein VD0001_g6125 [Verticillium dahliae]
MLEKPCPRSASNPTRRPAVSCTPASLNCIICKSQAPHEFFTIFGQVTGW